MAAPGKAASAGAVTKVQGGLLHIERWFKAPPAKVFSAWSDPKLLPKFFWPVGTGRVDELEFKVGGRLVMGHTTEPWTATWTYVEIVPDERIVTRDPFPGTDVVATGTMEFIAENGGTRLKVTYGPFPKTGPYTIEGASVGFSMVMERLSEAAQVPGEGEGFELVRYLNAPAKRVWEMWTTKEGLQKWWAPSAGEMGYRLKVLKLDVRVGGEYAIEMRNAEHALVNHGVYTEVQPHRRLAQRWDFDIFLGPGEKPYPIAIAIAFEEVPTMAPDVMGTRMTFTQGPMAKAEHTEGSRQGVIQNLRHLAKALGE
ncbi:MAG TPA: SRPBCC family protein [Candidatus Thermoplasmatota archaeon]|nr:SRPBCC family protein [Candidatus Thermoplasmatota archaeon]